jgi:hypothetical protein
VEGFGDQGGEHGVDAERDSGFHGGSGRVRYEMRGREVGFRNSWQVQESQEEAASSPRSETERSSG